jgi:hypothetical protein
MTGSVGITGSLTVAGNILPSADNLYTLGAAGTRFNNIYSSLGVIGTLYPSTIRASGNSILFGSNQTNYWGGFIGNSSTSSANFILNYTSSAGLGGDNGATLQVNGTNIASASLGRGVTITNTISASANSDVLVGLDINPTFNTGSFTGVTNYAIRLANNQFIGARNNASINYNAIGINNSNTLVFGSGAINSSFNGATLDLGSNSSAGIRFFNGTQWVQIFGGTGNLTLQNGGTFTDAGYRLDVAGTTRFQGTTASDTAPLGSELAAVTGSGTNWTLAGTNLNVGGYTHTTGDVTPLITTLAAVAGIYYQITYTITGRTAGSITIAYGGTSLSGISATGNTGPLASSTSVLTITPDSNFDGTVVLSIKSISTSSVSSTFANSSGTSIIEFRAGSSTSNLSVGQNTGRNITTGINNTFIGSRAGMANTTAQNNTFVGNSAGQNVTIGNNNSFFGTSAGSGNTTGNNNTFFGAYAAQNNTSGGNNTFIGQGAGATNTTGNNSTFVGHGSGFRNISSTNTAMGYFSLYNTTGTDNVAVGNIVMQNNTTGATNTAFGVAALYNNVSGNKNIALGAFAGNNAGSGSTTNTTSSNSLYIGYDVRSSANGNTNEVVIAGYNGSAGQIGLGSNTTVLGNSSTVTTAIYGDLILGSTVDNGTDKLQVTGNSSFTGSVGITGSLTMASGSRIYLPDGTNAGIAFSNNPATGIFGNGLNSFVFNVNGATSLALYQNNLRLPSTTTVSDAITGNKFFGFSSGNSTANSSTNYLVFGNAVTGSAPSISAVSDSASDVSLNINSKGTGSINLSGSTRLNGTTTIVSASLDYQQNLAVATGSFQTITSAATGSFRAAFFDYVAYSGSVVRAGTLVSTWSGSVTEYYENYTNDLGGSTSVVTLQTAISGSNIQLQAGISGSAWSVRSLVRLL